MKTKKGGYILVFVLFALSMVATAVLLLARGSNSLSFESNRTHREFCVRNLLASGRAWAQAQSAKGALTAGQVAQLETDSSGLAEGKLTVTVVAPDQVRIEAHPRRSMRDADSPVGQEPYRRPGWLPQGQADPDPRPRSAVHEEVQRDVAGCWCAGVEIAQESSELESIFGSLCAFHKIRVSRQDGPVRRETSPLCDRAV